MIRKIICMVGVLVLTACGAQSQVEISETRLAPTATVGAETTSTPRVAPSATLTVTPEATLTQEATETPARVVDEGAVQEFPVTEIAITGDVGGRNAEISGLAWYGDTLILMPQYPKFDRVGNFYALQKEAIEAYLATTDAEPLTPQAIPVRDTGLASQIDGFEGYEAIAFVGDRVYLTVEANTAEGMRGYLVAGQIAPDLSELVVETAVITEILPQTNQNNHSDETLLVDGETLITIYETNGVNVNENPMAHRFNEDLSELDTVAFPHIAYRVTDATEVDENGCFWVINYFYPGDTVLQTEADSLVARQSGWGTTHLAHDQIERLVELQFTDDGIVFTDTPPILLELPSDEARNWEGIVRLNDGFLLATDKFPETILGYVEKN